MSVGGGAAAAAVVAVSVDIARASSPGSCSRPAWAIVAMLHAVVIPGPGASGTAASMRPHVEGLRARGVEAEAVDLPTGRAERAVVTLAAAAPPPGAAVVVGGHSYGGRVASMLAAEDSVAGLV